jgi:L-lactate dehydrogenase
MKVSIIGLGMVGKEVLHYLLHFSGVKEIVVFDLNKEKAQGEIFDFEDTLALQYSHINKKIILGDMSDTKGSNLVIINASSRQGTGVRSDLAAENNELMKTLAKDLKKYNPNALFLITTNPNDNIVESFLHYFETDPKKVIGTGTLLDTMRLQNILAQHFTVANHSLTAFVLGEHGPSAFIAWSLTSLAGLNLEDVINLNGFSSFSKDEVLQKVIDRGIVIYKARHYTDHGIGASTCRIANALLQNENAIYPVSTHLQGQFGVNDISLSLPCIINSDGATKLNIKLTEKEMELFHSSVQIIRNIEKKIVR